MPDDGRIWRYTQPEFAALVRVYRLSHGADEGTPRTMSEPPKLRGEIRDGKYYPAMSGSQVRAAFEGGMGVKRG